MFSRLSIKIRIWATVGCLVTLLLAIGVLGQVSTDSGRTALRETYSVQLASAVAMGDSKYNLAIARVTMDRALLHPESPDLPTLISKVHGYLGTSKQALARYLAQPHDAEEQRLADVVSANFDKLLNEGIEPALQALQHGDPKTADTITMTTMPALSLALTKSTDQLNAYLLKRGSDNYDGFQQTLKTMSMVSAAVMLLGVAIAALCALGLQKAISVPLTNAVRACSAISKGDLTHPIAADGHDEMGHLMRALSAMRDGLLGTVSSVRDGSASMVTATQEIAAGNADLSRRTESQAAALEQTAASMEQLTATVKQNNANASHASQLAKEASEIAASGGGVMDRVVGTMADIHDQSEKMSAIIGAIEGIAFQTNILALNAAVEAARAGEQGRGFAVVASEVRTLAQRSAAEAKEIKGLIQAAATRVGDGTGLVETAGTTMQQIVQSIRRVSDIMTEVAAASGEQSDGIEQVNRAVAQMDEVTQQNAALVEQTTAAALSLDEQAKALQLAVSRFRL
ncbi:MULTISPECIES: methyl-accepting chemotaxis protein [Paraburkholderia]|jgi:methyl-accepting chemotaxis protein-1 (serine sensor receptor)|uniref:Methyl-accepting chemotaxis sensory transducer with TarH sensor n=1 Tax=Paraburkholderia phenazinium TaxID=60549 RepID=A0A1N6ISM1_9BURK|nr:methyl-accepting chemotaxis protein [Paraburkholderia phenazinium]SIO35009.1 methyl-accepting chemotaxis sensory transducer with TarH sensor [Paraburkholderia phenazinium]